MEDNGCLKVSFNFYDFFYVDTISVLLNVNIPLL